MIDVGCTQQGAKVNGIHADVPRVDESRGDESWWPLSIGEGIKEIANVPSADESHEDESWWPLCRGDGIMIIKREQRQRGPILHARREYACVSPGWRGQRVWLSNLRGFDLQGLWLG